MDARRRATGTDGRREERPASPAACSAFAFLAGQLWAWQQLNASGHFTSANPAYAFFFLLTALHGIHLLGGLWVWARATARVLRGAEVGKVRLSVELCTVYWHFLLAGLGGPVRGVAEYPSIERIEPHDAIGGHRIGRSTPAGSRHAKASSPTGRRTSARSRRCRGARR